MILMKFSKKMTNLKAEVEKRVLTIRKIECKIRVILWRLNSYDF